MPSTAEALGAKYRQQVLDKLPKAAILPASVLSQYPPGSDVSKVPETCGLLTADQVRITNRSATALVEQIAKGQLKAVDVTLAFGLRAAIAHQLVCCLTDIWLDEALERARQLDDHFARTGKTVGPLHGLPISLKDQFAVKGKVTSLSFLSLHQRAVPEKEDAQLVSILQNAGAIMFCHTTLPQTIMHLECESFWGVTLNPHNTATSSGGSSGGEGALVAMRGSPLGVGTDIGGSVRLPAANCGLYGLRPTTQRVPNKGCKTYVPGRDSILGVIGPFAHAAEDVSLFMRVIVGAEAAPWRSEPALQEMPWTTGGERRGGWEKGERKLRVGVMWNDGQVRPVKPIERALRSAVEKIKKADGVEVVDFAPFKTREGWELIRQLYFVNGGRTVHDLLDKSELGEPLLPLTKWLLEESGPPLEDVRDVHRLWEINVAREGYRSEFAAHWNASGIDVLLCPAAPQPASPHGEAKWWGYTSQFNLVDYPCIAFPSGLIVDASLDAETSDAASTEPLSADDKYLAQSYRVNLYTGCRLPLQLVARKYHDEELMEALKAIEGILA